MIAVSKGLELTPYESYALKLDQKPDIFDVHSKIKRYGAVSLAPALFVLWANTLCRCAPPLFDLRANRAAPKGPGAIPYGARAARSYFPERETPLFARAKQGWAQRSPVGARPQATISYAVSILKYIQIK